MNIDRTLNIYQSYSLAKISALNKQMLKAQYAQCEQIGKLEKSITKELKALNAANQQIIENQIKEAKRHERLKYYSNLAHNIKECIELIDNQKDLLFKSFLLALFHEPLSLYLQEAKANLEEISDKEFCSNWEKVLSQNASQANAVKDKFNVSPFHTLIEHHESFIAEEKSLNKQLLNNKIERLKIKEPNLAATKTINAYQSKGCLITMSIIAAFSFLVFIAGIAGGDEKTGISDFISLGVIWIVIPVSLLLLVISKTRKKKKTYNSYVAEISKSNYERQRVYDELVKKNDTELANIEAQENILNQTHPYSQAKLAISMLIPEWETVVDKISSALLIENGNSDNSTYDTLLPKAGKFAIKHKSISVLSFQREYGIRYKRAEAIIAQLENLEIIERNGDNKSWKAIVDEPVLEVIFNHYNIKQ